MANKRRRINDVETENINFNSEEILNNLDTYPFLYRAIQSISYIKKNPLMLSSNSNITEEIKNYIMEVTRLYYGGLGLSYNPNETKINENTLEIYIDTPFTNEDASLNLYFFLELMKKEVKDSFFRNNLIFKKITFVVDGNMLWFNVTLFRNDEEMNNNNWDYLCFLNDKKTKIIPILKNNILI